MIANDNQCATSVSRVDAPSGIGEHDSFDPHAGENAHGKRNLLRRISLVKVNASLHGGDGDAIDGADDQIAGVADRCALRERRNLRIRNAMRVPQIVGEASESGAQDKCDARAQAGARE